MLPVVIGASAGGLQALAELFGALDDDFQRPVLVVKHHARESADEMITMLARSIPFPVVLAEDKMKPVPGTVVMAPPDYHMLLEADGSLSLSFDEPVCHARPSIDVLFESTAMVAGQGLIAVVLTGASRDGAMGADAVRQWGGQVLIQAPETAEVPVMPRAAMKRKKYSAGSGCPVADNSNSHIETKTDYISDLPGLADRLNQMVNHGR